jgi:hypothetical protein
MRDDLVLVIFWACGCGFSVAYFLQMEFPARLFGLATIAVGSALMADLFANKVW